jgi:hypothetical protein
MSFERHHPNRAVDRNLGKARDLRSAYLLGCLAKIPGFIARTWRARQRGSGRTSLATLPPSPDRRRDTAGAQ